MELDLIGLLLLALAGGLLANLIELPLIWWFTRSDRLIKRLQQPDEDLFLAIQAILSGFAQAAQEPIMNVGKDENGKAIMVTPFDFFASKGAEKLLLRMRGVQGSVEKAAGQLAGQFGFPMPRKGQSTPEFLFEQIMQRAAPAIDEKVSEILNKKQASNNLGGSSNNRFWKGD